MNELTAWLSGQDISSVCLKQKITRSLYLHDIGIF